MAKIIVETPIIEELMKLHFRITQIERAIKFEKHINKIRIMELNAKIDVLLIYLDNEQKH